MQAWIASPRPATRPLFSPKVKLSFAGCGKTGILIRRRETALKLPSGFAWMEQSSFLLIHERCVIDNITLFHHFENIASSWLDKIQQREEKKSLIKSGVLWRKDVTVKDSLLFTKAAQIESNHLQGGPIWAFLNRVSKTMRDSFAWQCATFFMKLKMSLIKCL